MSNKYDLQTFQGLILTLQDYWASQGLLIVQPFDMEVGAGTSHPMTFLRSLGPEPISCAYVQPSRRPTDGRYGENPNRLQHYYQFQVILKPSPDNIQELYLGSLKELGFKLLRLKTGTPQRIDKNTVNFSVLKPETGDMEYLTFNCENEIFYDINKQEKCYLLSSIKSKTKTRFAKTKADSS